jgi:hypothetical protein
MPGAVMLFLFALCRCGGHWRAQALVAVFLCPSPASHERPALPSRCCVPILALRVEAPLVPGEIFTLLLVAYLTMMMIKDGYGPEPQPEDQL